MLKRICPVCEQVMKGRHYCPACRSFVKRPKFIEADYYLNERHPSFEKDCDYHNPSYDRVPERETAVQSKKHRYGETPSGGTSISAVARSNDTSSAGSYAETRNRGNTSYSRNDAGNYINGERKQNPAASALVILTVIVIMISLLTVIVPFITIFFF